jgi:Primase C terminal 1 (PriCT-1)
LTFGELKSLSIAEIRELAKMPRTVEQYPQDRIRPIEKAERLYQKCSKLVELDKQRLKEKSVLPKGKVTSIDKLPVWVRKRLDEPVAAGIRNLTIFQLGVAMAEFGIDKEIALPTILNYGSSCSPPLAKSEVESAVESAFAGVERGKYSVGPHSDSFREFAQIESYVSIEAQEMAESILKEGDILKKFIEDTNQMIVRDERVRRNLFRVFASSFTDDPINFGLPGPPSIGKSFLAISLSKFLPQDQVLILGGLSPTALIHEQGEQVDEFTYKVDLAGKVIIFTEPPGQETLENLLPILSHDAKEIHFKFADRSQDGRLATMTATISGWPAVILCGTMASLFSALSTRFIIDQPEITLAKIEQVIASKARAASELGERRANAEATRMVWTAAFEILSGEIRDKGPFIVSIPFAEIIARHYTATGPLDMRFIDHLLRLIKANAVIHYQQRTRDSSGFLIASPDDFEQVLSDFKQLVAPSRRGIGLDTALVYSELKRRSDVQSQFSFKDIYAATKNVLGVNISSTTVRDLHLKGLVACGLLEEATDPMDSRKKVYATTDELVSSLFDDDAKLVAEIRESCEKSRLSPSVKILQK